LLFKIQILLARRSWWTWR